MTILLFDGPENAQATILLAHGAGAPMDAAAMNLLVSTLVGAGFRVARFEFAYMAARRQGQRKPPPRAETLQNEYRAAIDALACPGTLIIGGKSMGGRVASMVADDLFREGRIAGLLCIGYPFHPPQKPEKLRTAHLEDLQIPTLIAQGTRDPFGTREEVAGYRLSPKIEIAWFEDGDHDLKPRKKVSGFTVQDYMQKLACEVAAFAEKTKTKFGYSPSAVQSKGT
jgi:predicted alpha/beta-hydrolase family hydrolase